MHWTNCTKPCDTGQFFLVAALVVSNLVLVNGCHSNFILWSIGPSIVVDPVPHFFAFVDGAPLRRFRKGNYVRTSLLLVVRSSYRRVVAGRTARYDYRTSTVTLWVSECFSAYKPDTNRWCFAVATVPRSRIAMVPFGLPIALTSTST